MKRANQILSLACCACAAQFLIAQAKAGAAEPASYRSPTSQQLAQAEQLFDGLFAHQYQASVKASAAELGLDWRDSESHITVIDEKNNGWGEYYFSKLAKSDITLQAPHRYFDKHTGAIAKKLFKQYEFTAIALNSVSRRTPMEANDTLSADMARLPNSMHSVYSRAFAARYPQGRVIQLHGFSAAKRLTPEAQQANMILSTGGPWSSAYLLHIQECFNAQGWRALRYPQQVRELGATRNSVGALLRNLGHSGFIHIELDLDTRKQLVDEPDRLQAFADCLLEPGQ